MKKAYVEQEGINMPKFYFTFGQNHCDANGNSLGNSFVVIYAQNELAARDLMFEARGAKWAFSYPEDKFGDQAVRFNLMQLPLSSVELPDVDDEDELEV